MTLSCTNDTPCCCDKIPALFVQTYATCFTLLILSPTQHLVLNWSRSRSPFSVWGPISSHSLIFSRVLLSLLGTGLMLRVSGISNFAGAHHYAHAHACFGLLCSFFHIFFYCATSTPPSSLEGESAYMISSCCFYTCPLILELAGKDISIIKLK